MSIQIDRTIYEGRPLEQRSDVEMRVYDCLDKLNISFQRLDHEPTATIADCAAVDELLNVHICKNLVLCNTQKTSFYLLVMHGSKPFKTSHVSKLLQSARLSFAPPKYMEQLLGVTPGSATILSVMNDKEGNVQVVFDADVLKDEYVGCHPCVNTSSLKIRTHDILHTFLPHTKHEPVVISI